MNLIPASGAPGVPEPWAHETGGTAQRLVGVHAGGQRVSGARYTSASLCGGYVSHPPHDCAGMPAEQDLIGVPRSRQIRRVLIAFARWAGGIVAGVVRRVHSAVRAATRPTSLFVGLVEDAFRSRDELIAENALLRQQLIVAARSVTRPSFKAHERGLMVLLASLVRHWQSAVLLIQPQTVLRWHGRGFRLLWRWKSRHPKTVAPRVAAETVELIQIWCM